jgi:membrane protease YdiL (CAAX protease family)
MSSTDFVETSDAKATRGLYAAAVGLVVFLLMVKGLSRQSSEEEGFLWKAIAGYLACGLGIFAASYFARVRLGFRTPSRRVAWASGIAIGIACVWVAGRFVWKHPLHTLAGLSAAEGHSIAYFYVCGLLLVPVVEEMLFRGLLWSAIGTRWPGRLGPISYASLVTALLFGFLHWPGLYGQATSGGWVVVASATAGGLVFGYLRDRLGVLWIGLAVHVIGNGAGF